MAQRLGQSAPEVSAARARTALEQASPEFSINVDTITECGQTCRQVTLTLMNTASNTVHNIKAEAVISTGGEPIWSGAEEIGTLDSGAAYQTTKRVELSHEDAVKVRQNDYIVTTELFLRTDQGDLVATEAIDIQRMQETTPSLPDLSNGRTQQITLDGTQYYLIDQIPGQPPNRVAVTTLDLTLTPVSVAREVIRHDSWTDMAWRIDWNQEIQNTRHRREVAQRSHLLGQITELGWNVAEILVFFKTGQKLGVIGATIDGFTDAIDWKMEADSTLYRETFEKVTACLANAKRIEKLADRLEENDPLVDEFNDMVGNYMMLQDFMTAGLPLPDAFDEFLKLGLENGNWTKSASAALDNYMSQRVKKAFVSLAVSLPINELENVVQLKSTSYAIEYAFLTARLPLLHRLRTLHRKLENNQHRKGDGFEYYHDLLSFYQMNALVLQGIAKYQQQIANSVSGFVWNLLFKYRKRAEESRQLAQTMLDTMRRIGYIHGQVHTEIDMRTKHSFNMRAQRGTQ